MKIVATVRTLNERANVERFVKAYGWVDQILVADGGSSDGTQSIAYLSNPDIVTVRWFREKVFRAGGAWRNPHAGHINFLITWAREVGADWVIFDDCDCVPNEQLVEEAHCIMCDDSDVDVILAPCMYVWGADRWFPDLSRPGQRLWAWRLSSGVCAKEVDPWNMEMSIPPPASLHRVDFPSALLHYFYPDEETFERKQMFYKGTGESVMEHPIKTGSLGPLKALPEWAVPYVHD